MKYRTSHIEDIINACLKNEQAAYYEVYNRYHHAMYNVSFRFLNDTMEAEDIMQESFIKAFQKLETFNKKSKYSKDVIPFGSWLKRIVINNCINQIRKNKEFIVNELENVADEIDDSKDTEFLEQKTAIILNQIQNLKPNYKLAVTLYLIEGYDYEEISEIMGISYQNSRTIVSRAKEKLRKMIAQKDEKK